MELRWDRKSGVRLGVIPCSAEDDDQLAAKRSAMWLRPTDDSHYGRHSSDCGSMGSTVSGIQFGSAR